MLNIIFLGVLFNNGIKFVIIYNDYIIRIADANHKFIMIKS